MALIQLTSALVYKAVMKTFSGTGWRHVVVRLAGLLFVGAVALAVVGSAVAAADTPGTTSPAPSAAQPSPTSSAPPSVPTPTTYYVAVGASESLGVQPTGAGRRGLPTSHGYANAVLATQRDRWSGLQLVHFGCPGITAVAALQGGGPCIFASGSEISAAVDFLRSHPGRTVLATVDLGFNDLWPCLVHHTVDATCVTAALGRVSRALTVIVHDLRAAGGPHMKVVGLLHNDPYLAAYLNGPAGRLFSSAALAVVNRFNTTLTDIYLRAGVQVANVPSAFSLGTSSPTMVAGHGKVPLDVAKVCALSWMCTKHNLHLNAAGYVAVASAITGALPAGVGKSL